MLRVFEIIAFKHVVGISLNSAEQTCDRQSTCYQTILRFHNWVKEIYSNSICLGIMEDHDQNAAAMISAVFVTHQHVDSWKEF